MTARYLLNGQLSWMQSRGFDVSLVSSPGEDLTVVTEREGVTVLPVEMEREIHPWNDLRSMIRLLRVMRKIRPQIVNAGTPKAGLLGMIAAWMSGVPVRIYTLRGLRLETKKGFSRLLLKMTEKMASGCASEVVCVSESLRRLYVSLGLVRPSKIHVLGNGSSNGVDWKRFSSSHSNEEKVRLQRELNIPDGVPVIGFVGRLVRDKGVGELIDAFELLIKQFPLLHLLLLGDFEKGDPVDPEIVSKIRNNRQIISAGFIQDVSPYYGLMDVFAFPSHREGFPNTPLEAACAAVPTVGFQVTGTMDAVDDGKTGLLAEPGNVVQFAGALAKYLSDANLRNQHGQAARERAKRIFSHEQVWQNLYEEYERLVKLEIRVDARITQSGA